LTQLMKITALVVVGGVLMDQEIIQIVMEEPRPILPNEEGVVINPGEDLKAENRKYGDQRIRFIEFFGIH